MNLPFSFLDNEKMRRFFHKLNPNFVPIISNDVRNGKLEQSFNNIKKKALDYTNINSTTPISIIVDEYREKDGRPILKVLLKGTERPIYYSTIDLSTEITTSENLSKLIENSSFDLVNFDRIVAITSDNCRSMVSISNHIFKNKTIKIEQIGCVCFVLNLLVEKSLSKIEVFNNIHLIILNVAKNIDNRKVSSKLMKTLCEGTALKPTYFLNIRWSTYIRIYSVFINNKELLIKMNSLQ